MQLQRVLIFLYKLCRSLHVTYGHAVDKRYWRVVAPFELYYLYSGEPYTSHSRKCRMMREWLGFKVHTTSANVDVCNVILATYIFE